MVDLTVCLCVCEYLWQITDKPRLSDECLLSNTELSRFRENYKPCSYFSRRIGRFSLEGCLYLEFQVG